LRENNHSAVVKTFKNIIQLFKRQYKTGIRVSERNMVHVARYIPIC